MSTSDKGMQVKVTSEFLAANPGFEIRDVEELESRTSAMFVGFPTTGLSTDRIAGGSVGSSLRAGVKTIVGSPCTPTTTCGGWGCGGSVVIYK